jgi:hypothetical protein
MGSTRNLCFHGVDIRFGVVCENPRCPAFGLKQIAVTSEPEPLTAELCG